MRVYLSLLAETLRERRWERFAWDPFTNPATWRDTAHHIERTLAGLPDAPVSPTDAVRRVERLTELLRAYVSVHVTSLLFANLSWQLLETALAATVPEQARPLMDDLAVSPPGNATLALNEALHELADQAGPDDLDALETGEPLSPAFARHLEAFLAEHGHRAQASWEILSPRWRDDPSTLAPVLRMHQRAGGRRHEGGEARHARALDALRELAPPLARPALLGLVWYTRRYLLLRENQRAVFDRLTARLADDLHWLGGWLVAGGHLDDREDVRWLTWSELSDAVRSSADRDALRGWVARRRAEAAAWPDVEPPTALLGDEGRADLPTGRRLQGQGLAPGRVRGPARVLRSPAEAHRLQPGDLLVARALDPSWTPLLSIASGVLVEMGGALSHGAVIAREYGVPMVGDVDGATRWLKDGDEITVDGRTGAVWLHP